MCPRRLQGISVILSVFLLTCPITRADEVPPDVALIPGDAAGFIRIEVKEILASSLFDDARMALAGLRPEELAAFAKRFPVDPATLERLLVIFPNAETAMDPIPHAHPTAVSAIAIATFSQPFDRTKLLNSFFAAGRLKSYRGFTYQFDEESWSGVFALPGDRTIVIGAEDSLIALMDQLEKGAAVNGPLAPARAASAGHTLFAAFNPAAIIPPETPLPKNIMPLVHAQRITLALDLGKTVKPELQLHFADARQAEAGEAAFREVVRMAREKIVDAERVMNSNINAPGSGPGPQLSASDFPKRFAILMGVGISRQLDKLLSSLPIHRTDAVVKIAAEWPLSTTGMSLVTGITAITALGSNASQTFEYVGNSIKPGQAGAPSPEEQRLKKLHAALEAYRAANGKYPPLTINGKDNAPLLSGRVALLPYLGEQKLYDQFRLTEPWDSLHNKKLIAKMPTALNRPHIHPKNFGKTNLEILTGIKAPADSAAPTILALENGGWDPVYWTKPTELSTTYGHPADPIRKIQMNSSWVLFADGSVKFTDKKEIGKSLPSPAANQR